MDYYFKFLFIYVVDIFEVFEWVGNIIWYQIFLECFVNGNLVIFLENVLLWGSKDLNIIDFFGGDIEGIIEYLDYLVEFGINGVYLIFVFEVLINYKYDMVDYKKIDLYFGDKEMFRKLVQEVYKCGICIMLDVVFNYIGDILVEW